MTREELKEHCKRQIQQFERVEKIMPVTPNAWKMYEEHKLILELLEQETKTGHCKDCKWWKDKDGVYRRGISAESKCPINRREVMEGMGYCFMFEPQESEG